jgi:hypothetical protein
MDRKQREKRRSKTDREPGGSSSEMMRMSLFID